MSIRLIVAGEGRGRPCLVVHAAVEAAMEPGKLFVPATRHCHILCRHHHPARALTSVCHAPADDQSGVSALDYHTRCLRVLITHVRLDVVNGSLSFRLMHHLVLAFTSETFVGFARYAEAILARINVPVSVVLFEHGAWVTQGVKRVDVRVLAGILARLVRLSNFISQISVLVLV